MATILREFHFLYFAVPLLLLSVQNKRLKNVITCFEDCLVRGRLVTSTDKLVNLSPRCSCFGREFSLGHYDCT